MNFIKSNLTKKIIIILITLMIFNIAVPKTLHAIDLGGILFKPTASVVLGFLVTVDVALGLFLTGQDWALNGVGKIITGVINVLDTAAHDGTPIKTLFNKALDNVEIAVGKIFIGPDTIFSGSLTIFNANIFAVGTSNSIEYQLAIKDGDQIKAQQILEGESAFFQETFKSSNLAVTLKKAIANTYVTLRNLAGLIMLGGLIFTGIRILVSSNIPTQKQEWLRILQDWVIGLALLIFSHVIMVLIFWISDKLTIALRRQTFGIGGMNLQLALQCFMSWDLNEQLISLIMLAYTIYLTVIFAISYTKRLIWICVLIVVAPITSTMYSFGKKGKSMYTRWLKEYTMTVFIQPYHMLIYYVLISIPLNLANSTGDIHLDITGAGTLFTFIYALVAMSMIKPAEKWFSNLVEMDKGIANMASYSSGVQIVQAGVQTGIKVVQMAGRVGADLATGGASSLIGKGLGDIAKQGLQNVAQKAMAERNENSQDLESRGEKHPDGPATHVPNSEEDENDESPANPEENNGGAGPQDPLKNAGRKHSLGGQLLDYFGSIGGGLTIGMQSAKATIKGVKKLGGDRLYSMLTAGQSLKPENSESRNPNKPIQKSGGEEENTTATENNRQTGDTASNQTGDIASNQTGDTASNQTGDTTSNQTGDNNQITAGVVEINAGNVNMQSGNTEPQEQVFELKNGESTQQEGESNTDDDPGVKLTRDKKSLIDKYMEMRESFAENGVDLDSTLLDAASTLYEGYNSIMDTMYVDSAPQEWKQNLAMMQEKKKEKDEENKEKQNKKEAAFVKDEGNKQFIMENLTIQGKSVMDYYRDYYKGENKSEAFIKDKANERVEQELEKMKQFARYGLNAQQAQPIYQLQKEQGYTTEQAIVEYAGYQSFNTSAETVNHINTWNQQAINKHNTQNPDNTIKFEAAETVGQALAAVHKDGVDNSQYYYAQGYKDPESMRMVDMLQQLLNVSKEKAVTYDRGLRTQGTRLEATGQRAGETEEQYKKRLQVYENINKMYSEHRKGGKK